MTVVFDCIDGKITARVYDTQSRTRYVDSIMSEFPTSSYDGIKKMWKIDVLPGMKERIVKRVVSLMEPYNQTEAFRNLNAEDHIPYDNPSGLISSRYAYLYEFQTRAVLKALNHFKEDSGFGLFMTMGVGKTITSLVIANELKSIYHTHGTIIICPKSLVKTWEGEIKRFMPGKSLIVIGGEKTPGPSERKRIYETLKEINYDYVIMPYSLATIDIGLYSVHKKTLIVDEASKIKNMDTGLTIQVKELGKHALFRIALSGSPIENWLMDYYSILDFTSPGFMSLPFFFKNYTVQKKSRFHHGLEVVGYKNLDHFRRVVEPCGIRMTKEEVAPWLPPKVTQFIRLEQGDEQEKMAELIVTKAKAMNMGIISIFQLLRMIDDSTQLISMSSCKTVDDMQLISLEDSSVKLDWLQDFIEEIGENKVMIFTAWARMANILNKKLGQWGKKTVMITGDVKEKTELLDKFRVDKEIQFLVCTDCLAYGINCDEADVLINFDLPFTSAMLNQRSDRIHRLTTKTTKYIYNLVGAGIETHIYELIYEKAWLSERVVENRNSGNEEFERSSIKKIMREKYGLVG